MDSSGWWCGKSQTYVYIYKYTFCLFGSKEKLFFLRCLIWLWRNFKCLNCTYMFITRWNVHARRYSYFIIFREPRRLVGNRDNIPSLYRNSWVFICIPKLCRCKGWRYYSSTSARSPHKADYFVLKTLIKRIQIECPQNRIFCPFPQLLYSLSASLLNWIRINVKHSYSFSKL